MWEKRNARKKKGDHLWQMGPPPARVCNKKQKVGTSLAHSEGVIFEMEKKIKLKMSENAETLM